MGAERIRRLARKAQTGVSAPHTAVRSSTDAPVSGGVGHDFSRILVQRQPKGKQTTPAKKKPKKPKPKTLTEAQVRSHISGNNKSTVSEDLLVCLIWKESGFDPNDKSTAKNSSATGLMQMTKTAVGQVNKSSPKGVHFTHAQMTDPAKNIDCGTRYLQIRIDWANGSTKDGLNGFGTGTGYADNILDCETCFAGKPANPTSCLTAIHP